MKGNGIVETYHVVLARRSTRFWPSLDLRNTSTDEVW